MGHASQAKVNKQKLKIKTDFEEPRQKGVRKLLYKIKYPQL